MKTILLTDALDGSGIVLPASSDVIKCILVSPELPRVTLVEYFDGETASHLEVKESPVEIQSKLEKC